MLISQFCWDTSDVYMQKEGESVKKKKILGNILLGLVFVVGLGIFAYPTISSQWNKLHASQAIASYQDTVDTLSEEDYSEIWNQAEQYNSTITKNTFNNDIFSDSDFNIEETDYWDVLNISGTGIMGYISIPEINEKIPIYHGTSEGVLQIAAGHMYGTKLPIGGSGNHSVIAAHRGLPSATLFTKLDELKTGDKFYIHILDEVLAYQVDQISDMIEKDDYSTLESLMSLVDGEDYVTLFTCTPYGINSHRYLVRGTRVAYHGEDDEKIAEETMLESVQNYYMLYVLLIILILLIIFLITWLIRNNKKKKQEGVKTHEKQNKDIKTDI